MTPDTRPAPGTGFLGKAIRIEPGEFAAVAASFLLYFCVLGGYFAVRPVRETIGTVLGAERVRDLYVWTWVVSLAIIPVYGFLCSKFRREAFLPWIYGFVALALAGCAISFRQAGEDHVFTGQFFYVMISVLNLFIVSVMWSFLLELFNPAQSKRLFGAIAAGGTAGALVGPLVTSQVVGRIGNQGVLVMGACVFVAAIVCQRILIGIWQRAKWERGPADTAKERPIGGNPFAGITLVLKSPYLLGIALFVIFLAAVNTFLYFEQLRLVTEAYPDRADRTRFFSRMDTVVQSLTILLQVTATGRLAARWGIGVLLTAVPIAMIVGLSTLAAFNTLSVLAVVFVLRRVGEYAFVRPGREMLYGRVDTETKYKAKNVIDVPIYRGGDALVAKATEGFQAAGISAAAVGAGIAVLWAINGWWLGRRGEHKPQ